jgi:hypothetical protein
MDYGTFWVIHVRSECMCQQVELKAEAEKRPIFIGEVGE